MPGTSLADIRLQVRELTRTPSPTELPDATINDRINDFYVFDLPRMIRTLDRRININVLLNAHQQVYELADFNTGLAYPNIADLKNWISSLYPPIYCNGRLMQFTQSQTQFYSYYSKDNARWVADGGGAPFIVTFTIPSAPVVPGSVTVSAQDAAGAAIRRQDNGVGGFIDQTGAVVPGTINYVTGDIALLEMGNPDGDVYVYAKPYAPSQPEIVLWFDNKLFFWPIPDQGYQVTFEADVLLPDLVDDADQPIIRQWAEFIAYGAAKKIFQRRMDTESVQRIEAEMEDQLLEVNSKFITQQSTRHVPTIYDGSFGAQPFWGNNNNGF